MTGTSVLSQICQVASLALISAAWQTALLVGVAAIVLRCLPNAAAGVRSACWTAVALLSVLLPLLFALIGVRPSPAITAAHTLELGVQWSFVLAAVWLMMSAVRAGVLLRSALRLRSIWKAATPLSGNHGRDLPLGRRSAVLCTSTDVTRPSVIGFFSPRILIPSSILSLLSHAELSQVVLHEMEHLRRGDDWINLLQQIGLVLFPLNPALLWLERHLSLERELACDEGVLRATNAPKSYATCLVHLADHRDRERRISLALGAWGRRSELVRRVHHILELPGKTMSRAQSAIASALVITGLASGAVALSHAPQLISFGPDSAPSRPALASPETVPSAAAASVQAVSFRPGADDKPVLVDAVLRTPVSSPQARPVVGRHLAKKSAAKHRLQRSTATMPWLLTGWTTVSGATPIERSREVVLVTTYRISTSYAAVPTLGGWLIVQL